MNSSLLPTLRSANRQVDEIRRTLAGREASERILDLAPDALQTLSAKLAEAGEYVSARPAEASPDAQTSLEIAAYKSNLEHLESLLKNVQAALLAQRAGLEADRIHLAAARAWTNALRQTR